MVLSTDLNSRLKDLFSKKYYQKLEKEIEKLGKVEELNLNIQFLYATSKALNKFSEKKDFKSAAYIYERLFKNNPSNLELFFNLIFTSVKATFFEYVEPHLLEQFKKNNSDPRILEGMGKMYSFYGDMNKANKYYQLLLNIKPEYKSVWYSFLAGMNYIADFDQDEYLKYCKEFNKSASINIENFKQEKSNVTKKVGFLSADFKTHSVSFFLEEVIKNIGENFELHALSNLKPSNYDDTTNNLKKSFHHWHELSEYQDENFVKYVRSLNLDIIIDLCGYTFNNRADALRARCAKTQITWCGYCNTLGLDNIDYLISDPNLIKKNEKNLYSEKILYMPNIWNAMIKPKNCRHFL